MVGFRVGIETERVDGGGRGRKLSLRRGQQNATDKLQKTTKNKQRWRVNFLHKKWLQINETVAFTKFFRCLKITDPRQLSILSYMRSDASGGTKQKNEEEEAEEKVLLLP